MFLNLNMKFSVLFQPESDVNNKLIGREWSEKSEQRQVRPWSRTPRFQGR